MEDEAEALVETWECENEGCTKVFDNLDDLVDHRDECEFRVVFCPECGSAAVATGEYQWRGAPGVENSICMNCDMCLFCHNASYRICEQCTRARCGSDAEDFIECHSCYSCYRCGCNCESDDDDGNILDYSTNVVSALRAKVPTGVRTYGIEIEVEAKSEDERALIADAVANLPDLSLDWVCKYDGSLSDSRGVEIVSRPMQLDEMRESLRKLFDKAKITERVSHSESCGTHIHVGRSSVTARTIARAWAPWAYSERSEDMRKVLLALAGRGSNSYAEWSCQSPVTLRSNKYSGERVGQPRMGGHYNAISTSSHYSTYEWRMFSGCTREITAVRYIETVDCLLNIAEEVHGLEVCFKPEVLLREIGKRIDLYPALKATYEDPRKRLGKFFDTIDAARKGTPRKMKVAIKKAGRDIPVGTINHLAGVYTSSSKDAFARFEKIATPPPKGIYIEKGISYTVPSAHIFCMDNTSSFYEIMEAMGAVITDEMVEDAASERFQTQVYCECFGCQNDLRIVREDLERQLNEDLAEVERRQINLYCNNVWQSHPLGHQDMYCGISFRGELSGCASIRRQSLAQIRRERTASVNEAHEPHYPPAVISQIVPHAMYHT